MLTRAKLTGEIHMRIGRRWVSGALTAAAVAFACKDVTAPTRTVRVSSHANLTNPAGLVIVYPDSMRGWVFYNDQTNALCSTPAVCHMVSGPTFAPLGGGSAELADSLATDGKALVLPDYGGTRFDSITTLRYSTYRQTTDAGNNLAISLQLNADFDLTDANTTYQGRVVYEPYLTSSGSVTAGAWQSWDAKAGKWWGTRTTVVVGGANVSNPCVQASPCTWASLLSNFPNLGVHSTLGAVVLKAGSGWTNFRGNVDSLAIGASGQTTVFDFEVAARPAVPAAPLDSLPSEYATLSDTIATRSTLGFPVLRQVIAVEFAAAATQADKQTAIAAVNGAVVGGMPDDGATGGFYLVRVSSDATGSSLLGAIARLTQFSTVLMASYEPVLRVDRDYRRPSFAPGQRYADWRLNVDSGFTGPDTTWALNAIGAPFAWGCTTGSTSTKIGVIDFGFRFHPTGLAPNVWRTNRVIPWGAQATHGTQVATIIAGKGTSATPTGVMWDAQLDIADDTPHPGDDTTNAGSILINRARNLVIHGVRAVNVSSSAPTNVAQEQANAQPDSEARLARRWFGRMMRRAAELNPSGIRPLWVFSSGNLGNNANNLYNMYLGARDSLPNETLVVTAASRTPGQLMSDVTARGLIDIAAPGQGVASHDSIHVTLFARSSAAAPLVTGTAGLMFALDPSLTAAQARTMILEGAVHGGRTASGGGQTYPLLNAYEALRRVASRPGAPLCGNRLWLDPDAGIVAQRDTTTLETLIAPSSPGDPWSLNYINVHHGGRRMDVAFGERYVLGPAGAWQSGTWPDDTTGEYSGAYKSSDAWWRDHDDSVYSHFTSTRSGREINLRFELKRLIGNSTVTDASKSSALSLGGSFTPTCARQRPVLDSLQNPTGNYTCTYTDTVGTWEEPNYVPTNVAHAIDPQGRFAIAYIGVWNMVRSLATTWSTCPDSGSNPHPDQCKLRTADSVLTSRVVAWTVTRGGAWSALSLPSVAASAAELWGMAIGESGRELMVQVGRFVWDRRNGGTACTATRHEWIDLQTSPGSVLYTRPVADEQLCDGGYSSGAMGAALRNQPAGKNSLRRPPGR